MTNPSEQALPFSEAAREAAARAIYEMTRGSAIPGVVHGIETHHVGYDALLRVAFTAAVNADPRVKALLKLAALTDEELVSRVVAAAVAGKCDDYECHAGCRNFKSAAVLAALGLPVDEQEAS